MMSMCEGPEARVGLECSRNPKKGTVLKQCEQGAVGGGKVREVSRGCHEAFQKKNKEVRFCF